jgi:hypothetical protein
MKSVFISILQILLGLATLPLMCALLYYMFNAHTVSAILYIPIVLSITLIIIFRKKEAFYIPLIITTLAVSIVFGINQTEANIPKFNQISWNTNNHNTTVPFFVHPSGHIYIKTTLLGEDKYLLFDTGADFSLLNEKYRDSNLLATLKMTDSQDITNESDFFTIDKLPIGEVELKNLQYGTMKKETWGHCGILKNQDSIAGILGNNVINNFVWDIDMVNHTIKIRDQPIMKDIDDAKVIPLIRNGKSWDVRFKLLS